MTATHGTSLGAAKKVIADRCMTEALNQSGGKRGVYCEGAHRKHCTASYSTMNFAAKDPEDLNLYGVFFELAVNRFVGSSTSGQWVQPPDSIIIAGMHLHCVPVTKLYSPGFIGWCTVALSVLDRIKTHKFLRGKAAGADQGIRFPTPGQQRTMSQPPLKSAKREADAQDDDSSSTSWPSVESSSDEVATTTEKLSKTSLEHSSDRPRGLQPAREARTCNPLTTLQLVGATPRFETIYVPAVPNTQKERVGGNITPTEPCEFEEFEQFKDVPTRSRPRSGRSSTPRNN